MQRVGMVVLLGWALGPTRPGISGTREMPSGMDQSGSAVTMPAAPLRP